MAYISLTICIEKCKENNVLYPLSINNYLFLGYHGYRYWTILDILNHKRLLLPRISWIQVLNSFGYPPP